MALEQLKAMTVVVADTGDFESKVTILFLLIHVFPSLCCIFFNYQILTNISNLSHDQV